MHRNGVEMGSRRRSSQSPRRAIAAALMALAIGVAVGACVPPRVRSHGNTVDDERLASIKVGAHSRAEVAEILGSPSSVAAFQDNEWYYIGDRTEAVAFLRPEVTARQVIVIRFDSSGLVREIEKFGMERGRPVEVVKRETPTAGNEITVWQQFVGNIGRFEGGKNKKRPSGE